MVAVKKDTKNHLSQRRLAQLGTVKNRSRDSGHMVSHFSLLHTPAGRDGDNDHDFSDVTNTRRFLTVTVKTTSAPYLGL